MRLPLLIGARPKVVKKGPVIPLGVGKWLISCNHQDSHILIGYTLLGKSLTTPLDGSPVSLDGPINVHVVIEDDGNEQYLDVYAERV
jgi:hypothetical protein